MLITSLNQLHKKIAVTMEPRMRSSRFDILNHDLWSLVPSLSSQPAGRHTVKRNMTNMRAMVYWWRRTLRQVSCA